MKSDFSETKNNIKEYEFLNSENIIELNIPEGFEAIGVGAFKNCEKLTKVTIPEGLKTIENYAFYGCKSLRQLTIPEGVKKIGDYAFCGCKNIKAIIFPSRKLSIGILLYKQKIGKKLWKYTIPLNKNPPMRKNLMKYSTKKYKLN